MSPAPAYQTAFDIMARGPGLDWALAIPFVILAASVAKAITGRSRYERILSTGIAVFAGALGVLFVALAAGEYSTFTNAYKNKTYRSSEGCLIAFHPMPQSGHGDEFFIVEDGAAFKFSDYTITQAFRNTESHGGPVHRDSRVRIWHVDGHIIRLEVAPHACAPAPTVASDYLDDLDASPT